MNATDRYKGDARTVAQSLSQVETQVQALRLKQMSTVITLKKPLDDGWIIEVANSNSHSRILELLNKSGAHCEILEEGYLGEPGDTPTDKERHFGKQLFAYSVSYNGLTKATELKGHIFRPEGLSILILATPAPNPIGFTPVYKLLDNIADFPD